jgi:hypothetical protein
VSTGDSLLALGALADRKRLSIEGSFCDITNSLPPATNNVESRSALMLPLNVSIESSTMTPLP